MYLNCLSRTRFQNDHITKLLNYTSGVLTVTDKGLEGWKCIENISAMVCYAVSTGKCLTTPRWIVTVRVSSKDTSWTTWPWTLITYDPLNLQQHRRSCHEEIPPWLNFLIIKPTRCTNFSHLFWKWNSTCFGLFRFPSSGVIHCTLSDGICHAGL
jgi:hypothetical protein